ncbi:crosslink repair DNA glycosylase YcaQ family protein [Paraburkholderia sp. BR10872]|uniref:DNA glycosylase AlkZ-like family protein n=1 Tax=Paraburkholderia sp. BR10872 TaxID=3236989 RepID=UPI0034D2C69B
MEQVFNHVKCVQLDPLKAIRESHELVCLSRGVPLERAKSLLTADSPFQIFTYPGHAMAILPLDMWPWFAFMRRHLLAKGWRGPAVDADTVCSLRALLRERDVITVKDLPKGTGTGWNRSSQWRIAAEWLLWTGEAVSTTRNGTHREYALTGKAIPEALLRLEPSDNDCIDHLVGEVVEALGVATSDDIADYFRLRRDRVERALQAIDCPKGTVDGWIEPVWLSRRAESLARTKLDCVTPLSPFDSLVWYRPRLQRLFGKAYTLEAYKRADERAFGHYFMPILAGAEIVGRVAPRRNKHQVSIEAYEFDACLDLAVTERALHLLQAWSEAAVFESPTQHLLIAE